jgi:Ca2+-binding EF-hand superfamily protein
MLTEQQRNMMDQQFDTLDLNGDGYLTEADYEAMGERICVKFGAPKTQREAVHASMRKFWQRMQQEADTDGDGKISRDEYLSAVQNLTVDNPSGFDYTRPIIEAIWKVADTDGDGKISKAEYKRLQSAVGLPEEVILETFQNMDSDGDGVVNKEELFAYSAGWGGAL